MKVRRVHLAKRTTSPAKPLQAGATKTAGAAAGKTSPVAVAKWSAADVRKLVRELRHRESELKQQHQELRRVRRELANSRRRLAELHDLAPVACLTLDAEGIIHEANRAAATMLRLKRTDLVGKKMSRFIAAESRAAFEQHRQRGLTDGLKQSCELKLRRPDGTVMVAGLAGNAVQARSGGLPRWLVALTEITASRQRHADLVLDVSTLPEENPTSVMRICAQGILRFANAAGAPFLAAWKCRLETPVPAEWRGIVRAALKRGQVEERETVVGGRTFQCVLTPFKARRYVNFYGRDITEYKRAEAALRESEGLFRALVESLPLTIFVSSGSDHKSEYINPAFTRLVGYTLKDLPTLEHWWPLAYPNEAYRRQIAAEWQRRVQRAIETKSAIEPMEAMVTCKDGSQKHVLAGFIPLGKKNYVYGLDLTERKRAEATLRRGKILSDALNKINEALHASLDADEIIRRLLAEGAAALGSHTAAVSVREDGGWRISHIHGMPARYLGLYQEDDTQSHAVLAIKSRQPVAVADGFNDPRFNRVHLRRHNIRAVLVAPLIVRDQPLGAIFFNYHHGPHDFSGMEVDFSRQLASTASIALDNARLFKEHQRAGEALRESEARFRALAEVSPDILSIFDGNGRLTFNSAAVRRTHGFAANELEGRSTFDFIHPEDRLPVEKAFGRLLKDRSKTVTVRYRYRNADGSYRWMEATGRNEVANPQIQGIIAASRDITDRVHGEEELRRLNVTLEQRVAERTAALAESEEKFRQLFTTVTDAILVFDAGTLRFVEANDAALRLYGYTRKELQQLTAMDLTAEPEASAKSIARATHGKAEQVPLRHHKKKDGTIFPVEIAASTFVLNGRTMYCGLVRDITERKRSEQLLHNTNRTLQAIRDCHEAMLRATTEEELLNEVCRVIVESGGERMAWVGFAEPDARKAVRPVAAAGFRKDYLLKARITWADEPRGRGPVGLAIRTGKTGLCQNTLADPNFAPWRTEARRCGYGSMIALPLRVSQQSLGALAIYAPQPEAFDAAEQLLLVSLANDLAFGLSALRLRTQSERLENEILKSINREQERIGRDLHDGLCQMLVGAKFRTGYLQKIPAAQFPAVRREARALEETLNRAIAQTRDLARGLNPVKVTPAGLEAALQKLAEEVESDSGPRCFCQFPAPVKISDPQVADHLYRIAQEAVQNALKHARAKNIFITLTRQNGRLTLAVRDDGTGLPRLLKKTGMGLPNMRTRASLIAGRLEMSRGRRGGTTVTCELFSQSKGKHETPPKKNRPSV